MEKNEILKDGTLTLISDGTTIKTTILSADEIATITTLISTTDFTTIKNTPFFGICQAPSYEAEVTYTIVTVNGLEEIASCTVAIDPTLPLFQTLTEILEKYDHEWE
ncbi:hypothetical protein ACP8Y2_09550 [Herpetosiphon llansteffanensis]